MLHAYRVGQLYHPGRTQWSENVFYYYRGGQHELLIFFGSPSRKEILAIRRGRLDVGLWWKPPVIWFLYRFQSIMDWSDAPYSIHLVQNPEERTPPTELEENQRMLLNITLIDAETGIIRALRASSLSPRFSQLLHSAIREQLEIPSDEHQYDRAIAETYRQYPHSTDLLRQADIVDRVGK